MPKKQQGSHTSPGPPVKHAMLQGLKTPKVIGILAPVRKQPQQWRYHLRSLYWYSPSRASLPHLKRQGTFSHLWPHISPESVNKAKRKVKCQEQGAGCIGPEWGIGPGMSGMWERRAGEQRNSCSPKPLSISRRDGAPQVCLGAAQANPCAQLRGRAATSAPGRYSRSGLTVLAEKTKGNWTKSVSD